MFLSVHEAFRTASPASSLVPSRSRPFRSAFRLSACLALTGFAAFIQAEPFRVEIQLDSRGDPLVLKGDYAAPRDPGSPMLIMLHGVGSTRQEWNPLVDKARRRGWGTLAYDARGHGESQYTLRGGRMSYQDVRYVRNPLFWRSMVEDLRQILRVMKDRKKIPMEEIVLIGASLGANVCLNAADDLPVIGAVLLSPGITYGGVEAGPALKRFRGSVLMAVSPADDYSFQSVKTLRPQGPSIVAVWLLESGPQGAHGVQMFDGNLEERVLDWIAARAGSALPGTKSPRRNDGEASAVPPNTLPSEEKKRPRIKR